MMKVPAPAVAVTPTDVRLRRSTDGTPCSNRARRSHRRANLRRYATWPKALSHSPPPGCGHTPVAAQRPLCATI
jgi:hypothetical protein